MDWVADIFGAVGSAATGGIFGLIGSGISQVVKYFRTKQEQRFEKDRWAHEVELRRLDMEAASQAGSWQGLSESVRADAVVSDTYQWVNAIKSLYRPALTTALVIISYQIFRDILNGLAGKDAVLVSIFTGTELKEIIRYIVYSLIFATSTAIVWWFSERAFSPPGFKNR